MGGVEHIQGQMGDGAEAAALDEDRFFVKDLGGLDDLAIGGEHGGAGEPMLDELERHEPVVHLLKAGPGELDHVDLDPLGGQVIHERGDEVVLAVEVERGVNEIDPDDAERLLLLEVLLVQHPDVDEDLRGLRAGLGLEADAHPAMGLARMKLAVRGDGIGKDEEAGGLAALGVEPLAHQVVLVLEHGLEALAADVAVAMAVDGVADDHVVGGNALCDGPGSAADAEEPPGDLLARADLGKRAILGGIEVDAEGLLVGVDEFGFHAGGEW